LQANEETPPALAPLFKVADVLEQELPKQDELTPQTKQAAAENILANANDAKLNQYAQYLGLGGKIYVHVFDYRGKHAQGETTIDYTKKHYENAAAISNERFKKLDINLEVVIIFDDFNAKPLTREEFQTRKADKTKRQTMPKGFDNLYNPMDSYMVINIQNDDNNPTMSHDKDKGIEPWLNEMVQSKKTNDWQDAFNDKVATAGKSSQYNFLGMVNASYTQGNAQRFYSIKADKPFSIAEIDKQIAESIASAIEHEVGHTKFIHYSANSLSSTQDSYMEGERNNNSLGKATLKAYLSASDADKNKFKFRENFSHAGTSAGHVHKTVMDEYPKVEYTKTKNNVQIQEGYDVYMQTMLKLLHGSASETKGFNIQEYKDTLAEMRLKRNNLYILLIGSPYLQDKDEIITQFEILEKKIEAYVDVLSVLDTRKDFQGYLKDQQKIETSNDELDDKIKKTNLRNLDNFKNFEVPK
jgi:hypothetical protein